LNGARIEYLGKGREHFHWSACAAIL